MLQEYEGEWRVTFEFQNAKSGALQRGFIFLNGQQAKQFSVESEIDIQYYGESLLASRLKGEDHSYWTKVFLGSIVVSMVAVAVLTWHGILEQKRLDNRKWWIK